MRLSLVLTLKNTLSGYPLVPVAASIRFSGLVAFSLVDDDELDEQIMSMRTASDEPFRFTYIEHPSEMLEGASFEALTLSDIPCPTINVLLKYVLRLLLLCLSYCWPLSSSLSIFLKKQ